MNESQYPTLRFMTCSKCGHTFVAGLDGSTECPECASNATVIFDPTSTPPREPFTEK